MSQFCRKCNTLKFDLRKKNAYDNRCEIAHERGLHTWKWKTRVKCCVIFLICYSHFLKFRKDKTPEGTTAQMLLISQSHNVKQLVANSTTVKTYIVFMLK